MPDAARMTHHGAALQSVIDRYGGRVREREVFTSIGVAASAPLGNNPDRLALIAVNLSPNTVVCALTPTVTLTSGIVLGPSGGSMMLDAIEDLTLPTREWFFIASAAVSQVYLLEVVRDVLTGD